MRYEKFLEQVVMMIAQHCECAQCHWILFFKMVKVENFMLCILYKNKKLHTLIEICHSGYEHAYIGALGLNCGKA